MADILFPLSGWPGSYTVPEENFLPDVQAYRDLLLSAGFEDIRIEDATQKCWTGFCDGQAAWSQSNPSLNDAERLRWREYVASLRSGVTHYLLVSARTKTRAE